MGLCYSGFQWPDATASESPGAKASEPFLRTLERAFRFGGRGLSDLGFKDPS